MQYLPRKLLCIFLVCSLSCGDQDVGNVTRSDVWSINSLVDDLVNFSCRTRGAQHTKQLRRNNFFRHK